jgi:hypothetical protein
MAWVGKLPRNLRFKAHHDCTHNLVKKWKPRFVANNAIVSESPTLHQQNTPLSAGTATDSVECRVKRSDVASVVSTPFAEDSDSLKDRLLTIPTPAQSNCAADVKERLLDDWKFCAFAIGD